MPVFRSQDFELIGGSKLADLKTAFERYGELSERADKVRDAKRSCQDGGFA